MTAGAIEVGGESATGQADGALDRPEARALGSLVHRAIAAGVLEASAAGRMAIVHEVSRGESDALRAEVQGGVESVALRADVVALVAGAGLRHELPISWRGLDGEVVRAVVDLVVLRPDGSAVVVEFKTGTPRESDQRQLDAYVGGIRALLPGIFVQGRIIRARCMSFLSCAARKVFTRLWTARPSGGRARGAVEWR